MSDALIKLLDQDKKSRKAALDPTRSFIVQAPAGSGKTELITQRFLVLLSRLHKGPEEIIAVTFTRKAAAEMRARIVAALLDAKVRHEPPEAEHAQLTWNLAKKALQHCEQNHWDIIAFPNRLRIVTIDSLSAHLTARMPILSNFGAEPEVIADPTPLYYEAVGALLASFVESNQHSDALKTLLKQVDNRLTLAQNLMVKMLMNRDQWLGHIFELKSQHDVSEVLRECFTRIIEETLSHLVAAFKLTIVERLLPLARYAANNLAAIQPNHPITVLTHLNALPDPIVEDVPFWLAIQELLMTKSNTLRKSITKGIGFLAPSSTKDKEEKIYFKAQKDAMEALLVDLAEDEELIEALTALSNLPPNEVSESQTEMIAALTELLPLLTAHLKLKFKESGKVDFIEIAQSAVSALGDETDPTDLALSLDYQIQHLLIDEFQDTSFQQFALFEKLVAGWNKGDGRSLFLVGDPMQSIYRFRGAEVGLFLKAKQYGLNQIELEPLTLTQNFRSTPQVVNWVNQQFKQVFPKHDDMSLGAVSYSASIAHQAEAEQSQVHFINCNADNQEQAAKICAAIFQYQEQAADKTIAVLVRARNHLMDILPLLRQLRVSYEAHDIESLYTKQSILDLLSLTQALLDLSNRVAWLAILRAPWCGLTLSDLHILASDYEQPIIWQNLKNYEALALSDDGKARLNRVFPILHYWLVNRRREDLAQWIKGAWLALGAPACYQDPEILDEAAVYFTLLAENSEGGDCLDFTIFEERLTKLFAKGYYAPSLPIENRNLPPVQLMTIHKSKGLEFDTVILPKLNKITRAQQQELLIWYERGHASGVDLIIAPRKAQHHESDSLYQHVSNQLKQKGDLEDARLLYVGATRAKNNLLLFADIKQDESGAHLPPADSSFLAKLWPGVLALTGLSIKPLPVVKPVMALNPPLCRVPATWQLPEAIQQHLKVTIEASEDNNRPENFYVLKRLIGIYVHRVLQLIGEQGLEFWDNCDLSFCEKTWQTGLSRLGVRPSDLAFALEQVILAVKNTLACEKGRWILANHLDAHNEWAIGRFKTEGLKQYIIDRIFTEGDTRWIVDYKTESVATVNELNDAITQHRGQVLNYKRLVESMGYPNVKCGLYFPLNQKWVEVD